MTGQKGEVDLAWTPVSDVSAGYNVYRAEGAGAYAKITSNPLPAGTSTYVDTAVTVGLTYSYQVHAAYITGESGPSNTVTVTVEPTGGQPNFRRGDVDGNAALEITDVIAVLGFQFLGDPVTLTCFDAGDVDDNGVIDINDPVYLINWLFLAGPEIPAPGPDQCGTADTSDTLPDCNRSCQ